VIFKKKEPKFEIGDLVQFNNLKSAKLSGIDSWIDSDENFILPGTRALVMSRKWVTFDGGECWEYDVSVPSLGIISRGWGDFALCSIRHQKEKI